MSIAKISPIFPTAFNNTVSLMELARNAVGEGNYYNISLSIPFDKLEYTRGGGNIMLPVLVTSALWETVKKFAGSLLAENYILGDVGELAQFTAQYPSEVAKYSSVFALNENSRWSNSDKDICVAYTSVKGFKRCFKSYRFDHLLNMEDAVIVFQQAEHRILAPVAQVL